MGWWGRRRPDLDHSGRVNRLLSVVSPRTARNALYYGGWGEEEVEGFYCLVLLVVERPPKRGFGNQGWVSFCAFDFEVKILFEGVCGVTLRLMEEILSVLFMCCVRVCSKGIQNTSGMYC